MLQVAGDPVIETHAESQHQISFLNGLVDPGFAVHARHAQRKRVRTGESAQTQQCAGHGRLCAFGEFQHLAHGAADEDAVTGQDDRPLGGVDQFQRGLQIRRHGAQVGPIAGDLHRTVIVFPFDLGHLGILGNIDQHRSRPAGRGDKKGFFDGRGDFAGVRDQVIVLGDGKGDAGNIRFLKSIIADQRADHLPGEKNHRDGIHLGGGNARDQVGGAGAGSGQRYTHQSRGAGVAVGHVRSTLFVAGQYMVNRTFHQGIVDGQGRAAGIAEHHFHLLVFQTSPKDFCSGNFHVASSTPYDWV